MKLRALPVLLQRLPKIGQPGRGSVEYYGLTEDYFAIHGITFDLRTIFIEGRPIRTGMNMEELKAYIGAEVLKETEDFAASTKAEGLELSDSLVEQVRKDLSDIADIIDKKLSFPTVNYVFSNAIVAQYGRTDKALRDYGTVDTRTGNPYVYGHIEELPLELELGVSLKVYLFCPFDLHQVREDGMIVVTGLTHEERIQMGTMIQYAARLGSVLRLDQMNKSLTNEVKQLNKLVEDFRGQVGELKRRLFDLQKQTGEAVQHTLSSMWMTITASQLGVAMFLFLVGVGIALIFPGQRLCTQLIQNATSGADKCVEYTVQSNPIASFLPSLLTLAGVILGPVVVLRFFRRKT